MNMDKINKIEKLKNIHNIDMGWVSKAPRTEFDVLSDKINELISALQDEAEEHGHRTWGGQCIQYLEGFDEGYNQAIDDAVAIASEYISLPILDSDGNTVIPPFDETRKRIIKITEQLKKNNK